MDCFIPHVIAESTAVLNSPILWWYTRRGENWHEWPRVPNRHKLCTGSNVRREPGGGHAGIVLLRRGPEGDREGPLRAPAPARPAQDGSAVAEESRLAPPPDRRVRWRLPADGTALPRRVPRRRPEPSPPLQRARPEHGVAATRALHRGVLLGPPATQRQAGRQGHRGANRPAPWPDAGPGLPQDPPGAALPQGRRHPRAAEEDRRG